MIKNIFLGIIILIILLCGLMSLLFVLANNLISSKFMLRKIIEKIDDILSYFCDFSILTELYLPLFGRRAFYDKKYGYAIERWFYPDNKTDYKCICFSPRDIIFLEK